MGYDRRVNLGRLLRFGRSVSGGSKTTLSADGPDAQFGLTIPAELAALLRPEELAPRIGRAEALQVPAVLKSRNLIAGTLSTLPVKHIAPGRKEVDWPLFDQPNPNMATSVVFAMTWEDLLFEGISWWRVTARDPIGYPSAAEWIDHRRIHVPPSGATGLGTQELTPDFPFPPDPTVIYVDGLAVPERDMIQFLSPNPPLLVHAARAIRTALRLDRTAGMYADEPMPLGYLKRPDGADPLSKEEIQKIMDDWAEARRKRAWAYAGGLEPKTLQFNAEQIQLADQRQHAVLEIARAAGVDPEDLGVSTTSRTYQNSEHRRQDLLDFTLGAYVTAVTDRLSMRDILPRGHVAKMKFDAFLRSTTPTRMQAYQTGLPVGAYTLDEIRDLEDKPPLTPAERARIEKPAAAPEQEPATKPATKPAAGKAPAMSQTDHVSVPDDLSALRFSSNTEPVRLTFDGDAIDAEFRVNADRRTISGLAVPWGAVARSGFSKWKFTENSLHWSSDSRVKMNLDHNRGQTVGRGVRLQSTSKGLDTTFQVARGDEGTKALHYAEDGVYDGFSIEIDFESEADGWTADPADESVRLVHSATLRAVALTAMPAFDDARVQRVVASRDHTPTKGEGTMPEESNQNPAGQGVQLDAGEFTTFMSGLADKIGDSHKTLTEELGKSIGDSVSAGFKAALENMHDPQDGPEPVRAARFSVTREAPIYTFDGRGDSLVRDAWYAQREHDTEAQDRIRKFHQQSAEVQKLVSSHVAFSAASGQQFATVTTGTASEVIPPGYRPDLFVPQLEQGRPFVNALSRGTIANATPFVVPTFAAATGLTGDHTEGSPADEGSLSLGTKTVTPGAISGKLPLTREIVDSSNPAIDQIALSAMREDYARQTEQKVYTLLNGANGQGGVITAGFVPSGAQVSTTASGAAGADSGLELLRGVRRAMALYPFRRFAAPNRALMSQEATTAFATAEDTTGRPLLPSVGAQNTNGLANAVQQGWNVDGLPFVPAWSISGNAAGDADIYMLNSADAWAWESPVLAFRFEEKQGPEIIELALFGYFATHLLRPVGLSAIRHTVTP